jgi:hypothetical protein
MEKTDANDARVIYAIASTTDLYLYPLLDPDPVFAQERVRVNNEYAKIRLAGEKPLLAQQGQALLGDFSSLSPDAQQVFGNGKAYLPTLSAVAFFAAQHASSRSHFERLLGLSGSAHPSLLRSEVHHHSFRHARKRGVTWQTYRRELRRFYALAKHAGLTPPVPQ